MARFRTIAICLVIACAFARSLRGDESSTGTPTAPPESADLQLGFPTPPLSNPAADVSPLGTGQQTAFAPSLSINEKRNDVWIAIKPDSAEFPKSTKIPGTEAWWKFGGFVKADFIHDFEPAGTRDRWVPTTIPVDGQTGQNTLMQAKASRFNLDVRAPSDWGTVRGFVETDFFTDGNQLRLRHAYVDVGHLLAGQTWSVFTDPDSIPRTLDFESPIAFIVQRNPQFRWTETLNDNLKWAVSLENPTTTVDDDVIVAIPGSPAQPLPDLVTHLKYKTDLYEWLIAGLFRDLAYRPVVGSEQHQFGCAVNLVGIVRPTDKDKIIAQFLMGNGLGRYRSGSDLRLASPTTIDTVQHMGGCFALQHNWTDKLQSNGVYSFALRRDKDFDPPNTERLANYVAANLLWTPIDNTMLGVEYLYGTNETRNGDFGDANRLQATVQYTFP